MLRQSLFEYAVLYEPKPTLDQINRGEIPPSEIIVSPTSIMAFSKDEVHLAASRAIPDSHAQKPLEDFKIIIRTFIVVRL